MADVTYKPDHRGTAKLMQTPEMHGATQLACYEAIPFAQSISPDAPPHGAGYIAAFEVDGGHLEKVAGTRRATAYLVNQSRHATVVEVGRGYDTGHHVLSRAADRIERG